MTNGTAISTIASYKKTAARAATTRIVVRRMNGDHYEVKVDGQWVSVPKDRIMNMVAPDGGAHVCAPQQIEEYEGAIFCVILPPEG
jgi:hypothetical protein